MDSNLFTILRFQRIVVHQIYILNIDWDHRIYVFTKIIIFPKKLLFTNLIEFKVILNNCRIIVEINGICKEKKYPERHINGYVPLVGPFPFYDLSPGL